MRSLSIHFIPFGTTDHTVLHVSCQLLTFPFLVIQIKRQAKGG